MLSGATASAFAMAGMAVFRIVVSSDSMKKATATSHGNNRFTESPGATRGSETAQVLARIRSLKRSQRWGEASAALDSEFKRLIGDGGQAVARLSETELLSRLVQDGPTHVVRDKTLMLTTLLKEAGDVAAAEDQVD